MASAKAAKQIIFFMPNKVGLMAEISAVLSAAKINVTAMCGYEREDLAVFMLMADDLTKAKKILKKLGAEIKDEAVVAVEMPNKVGQLDMVSKAIAAAGVNIHYFYGSTGAGKTSTCIFKTADNKKVIKVLNA
ncbi:MAG TPA: ACT domain-containing protein [Dissulfurispiraceae bacterium]|nr:ACT domain-containing protein [Dissulfurispiraceae bacterium]